MLMTIEKVLILKATSIMSEVREEILGEVARRSVEVNLDAGECLFNEGEIGSCLYVVVSGRLAVEVKGEQVAEVGEREVVGELAALDPEPRLATVRAITPASLLRISNQDINVLMSEDVEVARSFITVLCRRLRDVHK